MAWSAYPYTSHLGLKFHRQSYALLYPESIGVNRGKQCVKGFLPGRAMRTCMDRVSYAQLYKEQYNTYVVPSTEP